jgi:hypothetical protein
MMDFIFKSNQSDPHSQTESEELKEIDKNYPFNVILKRILTKNEK